MKSLVVVSLVLMLGLAGFMAPSLLKQQESTYVPWDPHDEEMNRAIAEARRRVPEFRKLISDPWPGDRYLIKVRFAQSEGGGEHIWLSGVQPEGARRWSGYVSNEPRYVPNLKLGQYVIVDEVDISDWSIHREGNRIGGFTQRVMERRLKQ